MNCSQENNASNCWNETGGDSDSVPLLKKAHDILIVTLLVAVMFAMGCHITLKEIWNNIRHPVGVLVGMASQFGLLPLSAFGLIKVFEMDALHGIGMLILACSPGGVTSNIYSYFCDGDIPLSITMTTCSTLLAMGMMPLNMWMYSHSLISAKIVIPYDKLALSLISVTSPVLVGLLVHWKFPKLAAHLTKIGSYAGMAIIVVCQTMEVFIFPDIFVGVPWQLYFSVVLLPILGFILGYIASFIFRQPRPARRTIAIESGVQNVGTALTVITLSFPFKVQKGVLIFPWLYAFTMSVMGLVVAGLYQLYTRYCSKSVLKVTEVKTKKEQDNPAYVHDEATKPTAYKAYRISK